MKIIDFKSDYQSTDFEKTQDNKKISNIVLSNKAESNPLMPKNLSAENFGVIINKSQNNSISFGTNMPKDPLGINEMVKGATREYLEERKGVISEEIKDKAVDLVKSQLADFRTNLRQMIRDESRQVIQEELRDEKNVIKQDKLDLMAEDIKYLFYKKLNSDDQNKIYDTIKKHGEISVESAKTHLKVADNCSDSDTKLSIVEKAIFICDKLESKGIYPQELADMCTKVSKNCRSYKDQDIVALLLNKAVTINDKNGENPEILIDTCLNKAKYEYSSELCRAKFLDKAVDIWESHGEDPINIANKILELPVDYSQEGTGLFIKKSLEMVSKATNEFCANSNNSGYLGRASRLNPLYGKILDKAKLLKNPNEQDEYVNKITECCRLFTKSMNSHTESIKKSSNSRK